MRLNSLWIQKYKNLRDVEIDFDEDQWVTVLIGWNGTGKSNAIEALAVLFRDLIQKTKQPTFSYKLRYQCNGYKILIQAYHDRSGKDAYSFCAVDPISNELGQSSDSETSSTAIPFSKFTADDSPYLPRYVFGYYSGHSSRLEEIFKPYTTKHDKKLRSGVDPGLKRLFYALPVHSNFVLLSFLLQNEDMVRHFLTKELGLDPVTGIESIMFVLRQPPWGSKTDQKDGFWTAKGKVREFLDRLYANSLAPIQIARKTAVSLWNKKTLEYVYLYLKDINALRNLVGDREPRQFFSELESTHVSDLIEEVRIRVKLKKNDGSVTFRELSEGEQQLLTVLGLLRFTAEKESLFLLDEPDTHLNPRWAVDYISYLKQFVGDENNNEQNSHILLTTHNPLAIAELIKSQVRVLKRDEADLSVSSHEPTDDPRGMGYSGIVTSDMFGLPAALDHHTLDLLEQRRSLTLEDRELTSADKERLRAISQELEPYGFQHEARDPLFREYLRARRDLSKTMPMTDGDPEKEALRRSIARDLLQQVKAHVAAENDE